MEKMRFGLWAGLAMALTGCTATTGNSDGDADVDTDADTDTDTGSDADTDTDTDSGTGTGTESDTGPGECDPIDDSGGGCTDGECCYVDGAARTCLAGGVGEQDDTCAVDTDCGCGYACVSAGAGGVCAHWCDLEPPFNDATAHDGDCPAPAICSTSLGDGAGGELGLICDTPAQCNEVTQEGCDAGEGCYVMRVSGITDCATAGDGVRDTVCIFTNDCASGFSCVTIGARNVCAAFCNPDIGDSDCTDGDTCAGQAYRTPDDSMPVGICTPA